MGRQHGPDFRILGSQHPRTKALQIAVTDQIQALLESAFVGVEDPLASVVLVEIKPGRAVERVPFGMRMIGSQIFIDFLLPDIFGSWVGFLILSRISGEPVISIDGNA